MFPYRVLPIRLRIGRRDTQGLFLRGLFLKGRQVVEWIDLVELEGMNEADEQSPDVSCVLGAVEKRVFGGAE